jgi:glycosidase
MTTVAGDYIATADRASGPSRFIFATRMTIITRLIIVPLALSLLACRRTETPRTAGIEATTPRRAASAVAGWRAGATCYEIFVRSFADAEGDGIGDLRGLTAKLDYINDGDATTSDDLGARCIWLMPVNQAASYHGYDATDYYRVERDYGTNDDFAHLVSAAHHRGIAVIVDMVLNHLSSDHPFFRDALGGPGAEHRAWFRWASPRPAERGPWGQEVWHRSPSRDEYYYGVFWRGMPDLDYETPAVREEAKRIAAFWLTEMGVDGFRLDAVPYLVEEGANQIGTTGTHAFLREYAASIRRVNPAVFTVGEVWDGLDVMRPYYPDQLESYFAFDLSDTLIAAVRSGAATAVMRLVDRYQRTVPNGRWATFLRNHDQTRTMTALGGDVARVKLAATLQLTLPGLPFVYYGEEIGMTGDKPDERIRTPMQWDASAHAGFTRGTPWEALQPDSATTTVAAQRADTASLLSLYRRLIHLRAEHAALGTPDVVTLDARDTRVAAYLRRDGDRAVLVVANLAASRVTGLELASADSVLHPGAYRVTPLLGGRPGAPVMIGADGRVSGYVPVPMLAPLEALVLELSRTR